MSDWLDDFMGAAWGSFVMWAAEQPEMQRQFTEATGLPFLAPPRTPLDALIDQATDARRKQAEAFVRWVTETHWGLDEAPAAYREALRLERRKVAK